MADRGECARIAGAAAFVSMADKRVGARNARASNVGMGDKGASARIVGAAKFVSMADGGIGASIVGAAAFVSLLPETVSPPELVLMPR